MSAQSTINQRMSGGLHTGPGGATVVIATALAGIGLAIALLWSSALAPKSQTAPAFDALAFRAEERALMIGTAFDAAAFRADEKLPLAGSAASAGSNFVGDRGLAPRTSGSSSFVGDRGIAPRTSGN
jgi:hypothetical protein